MAAAETDKVLGDLIDKMRGENGAHADAHNHLATQQLRVLNDLNIHLEGIGSWVEKMAVSFQDVKSSLTTEEESGLSTGDQASIGWLKKIGETGEGILNVLGNILNLGVEDSRAAREAAAEAARGAMGTGKEGVPDAKVEEAKAGGFFSKMGRAVMNPVKALGSGMKSIGKGIEGILTGIARGLMAFANPMVLLGVTVLSLSLPIFAAGLAAAFKVFDMIMGQGKALELVTGIIESLGVALGTVLEKILIGIGKMIKHAGPGIKDFFKGIGIVIEAIHPIIVDVFKVIKDIITDPVLNKTIQKVLDTIKEAIRSIERVLIAFAPVVESILIKVGDVIIAVADKIEKIVATVGSVIEKILGSFDNVVNQIEPIIKAIGTSISGIIDSISAGITKLGTAIEGIINSIGTNVTKVINSISGLVEAIGKTITGVIDGIVTGIERLSTLDAGNMAAVAGGLALLAGGLVLFSVGAMIGGAAMPSKETLEGIAKSVERFGAIEAGNLALVGAGMAKVGLGLGAFGVGGAIADLLMPKNSSGLDAVATSVQKFGSIDATNFGMVGDGIKKLGIGLAAFGGGGVISSLGEAFSSWMGGDKDPVEKFKKFAAIGPGLKDAGDGVTALAKAFDAFNTDNLERIGTGLDKFLKSTDMDKLTAFSRATEGLMTGKMLAQLQVESNNLGETAAPTVIVQDNSQNVQSSQPLVLPTSDIKPGNGENTLPG